MKTDAVTLEGTATISIRDGSTQYRSRQLVNGNWTDLNPIDIEFYVQDCLTSGYHVESSNVTVMEMSDVVGGRVPHTVVKTIRLTRERVEDKRAEEPLVDLHPE